MSVGVASGILIRGVQIGHGGAALQATAAYYSSDMWFVAVGGATLGSPWNKSPVQLRGDTGYVWRFPGDWSAWSAQLDLAYYAYPFDASLRTYEHVELAGTLAYRDLAYLSVSRMRSNRSSAFTDRDGVACDLVLRYPLRPGLAANAGVGRAQLRSGPRIGYSYGHLGISKRVDALQLDLSYIATDASAKAWFGADAADRWAASATWTF